MAANPSKSRATNTTLAFRHLRTRKDMLRAIGEERGHGDLSQTLREAMDEYIERHLRERVKSA